MTATIEVSCCIDDLVDTINTSTGGDSDGRSSEDHEKMAKIKAPISKSRAGNVDSRVWLHD